MHLALGLEPKGLGVLQNREPTSLLQRLQPGHTLSILLAEDRQFGPVM